MCSGATSSSNTPRKMVRRSAESFLPPAPCHKGVSFSSVHIHEHPIVLGDNPSCSSGPPVSLGWRAETSLKCSIDEYEAARRPERRRSIDEMRIPPKVRTEWLLADSVAPRQIHEAVQDLNEHKHRRRVSLEKSPLQDKADELGESVRRRLHRAVGRKARSNDLYTQMISQLEVARDLRVGDKKGKLNAPVLLPVSRASGREY